MTSTALVLRGVGVSPGRRAGVVARMPDPLPAPSSEPLPPGTDLAAAADRVDAAAATVHDALLAAAGSAGGEAAQVLAVTAEMAADPTLVDEARRRVLEASATPQRAVWDAAAGVAEQLVAL
ncbi:phosphoenolpyruvate-utilizing N-terminal domain-containing protein, partial [Cellulomonas algicola]|uniref:phosphoenolpyruvate-utilizing N-terminal domain-containing protein n=1 Tax=Cellulomonas algicola TaxID=2071633 RepID=UPI0027D9B572